MLTVNLLEPRDWSSGQVPDSVEHISSMDPIVVCQSKNERSVSVNLTTDSVEGSGSGSGSEVGNGTHRECPCSHFPERGNTA